MSIKKYYIISGLTLGYGWLPLPIGFCYALWRLRRSSERPRGMSYKRTLVGCVLGALVGTLLFQAGPHIATDHGTTELGCESRSLPLLGIIDGIQEIRRESELEKQLSEFERHLKAEPRFLREALWLCKEDDGSLTNSNCHPTRIAADLRANFFRAERGATFQIETVKQSEYRIAIRGTLQQEESAFPLVLVIEPDKLENYLTRIPTNEALKAFPPEIVLAIENGEFVDGMNAIQLRMALGRPDSSSIVSQTPWFDGPVGMSSFVGVDGRRTVALFDEDSVVVKFFGAEEEDYAAAANQAVRDHFQKFSEWTLYHGTSTLVIVPRWIDARQLSASERISVKEEISQIVRQAYKGSMAHVELRLRFE